MLEQESGDPMGTATFLRVSWSAGYEHSADPVVNDLVDCLEDLALPLMQFTEAFAVVQVT